METDHLSADDANSADGEGVWSPEIEASFQEALRLFKPCGRRKHILQDEGGGKMYGRNELIARHIYLQTGKIRTRKQVSSHIQVLARRKAKVDNGGANGGGSGGCSDGGTPSPASGMSSRSTGTVSTTPSAEAANSTNGTNKYYSSNSHKRHLKNEINVDRDIIMQTSCSPTGVQLNGVQSLMGLNGATATNIASQHYYGDVWNDRPIVTQKIRLVEFSAIEHRVPSVLMNASDINSSNNNNNNNDDAVHPQATGIFQQHQTADQASQAIQMATQSIAFSGAPPNLIGAPHWNHLNRLVINPPLVSSNAATNATTPQTGFTRHSYVKMDFRQPQSGLLNNKLERIDISQIQDKFPEIGGPQGLFQRGPPDAFFLVKFWADLSNLDYLDHSNVEDQNSYFGFTSHFETINPYKDITCSTKACSYGLQVVEKVEKIYGAFNSSNGRYSYGIERSPMCEFMIQFIKKLRQLPRASQMNSVLENFSVLQVVTSEATSEILLCLAFVFEIATEQNEGPQYHVYKLTKD